MRHITRALFASLIILGVSACSIGDGNGIVSLQIVKNDATSESFEMRGDQCEGFLLDVIATFTDGQVFPYTHRVTWSVSSTDVTIGTLENEFGLVVDAIVQPATVLSPGSTFEVTAEYLGLTATQEVTISDDLIRDIVVTPPVVEALPGELKSISVTLITNNDSVVSSATNAISTELDNSDAFTINEANAFELQSVKTPSNDTNAATLTVSVCSDIAALTKAEQVETYNYKTTSADAPVLEIRTDTDGFLSSADRTMPQDYLHFANAVLKHRFGSEVDVTLTTGDVSENEENTEWSISNNAALGVTVDGFGRIETPEASTGTATVSAVFTAADGNTISDTLDVTVAERIYQDDNNPFLLRDASGNSIDTTASPAFEMPNLSEKTIHYLSVFKDGANNPYEIATRPLISIPNGEHVAITAGGFVAGINNSDDSVVLDSSEETVAVSIDTTDLDASATNNIGNFEIFVHASTPSDIIIDSNNDGSADTAATVNISENIDLRALLPFAGHSSIDRTANTIWISDANHIAVVSNTSNRGRVTAINSGTATITAIHTYIDHELTSYVSKATFDITVP